MCGISGAVGFIDDTIQAAVRSMNKAQEHRGPDGNGFWSNVSLGETSQQGVALAHRRLSIIDLSEAGAQPMHDMTSGSVIVYNGEIYNYRELRVELVQRGYTFSSYCDTEVFLRSLVVDGISALSGFNGMFGFAYWDPATRVLQLGRDRLGIKPVYYTTINRSKCGVTMLFASELRALLASNLIERHIDPEGLDTYLWNGFVSGSSTLVAGVSLLPSGTTLSIKAGEYPKKPEKFWTIPKGEGPASTLDEVKEAFESAVSRRLVSDVPLGIFLSGGIDSSAVAAAAVQTSQSTVHTFNVGFPEVEYDESKYAYDVARQLGTEHQCIELTESDFTSGLDKALQGIDQPTFDGINTYFVSQAVREAGVTVALAGIGGDELFGGYTSFVDLPAAIRVARWSRLIPENILRNTADLITRCKVGRFGAIPPQTRWGKLGDVLMSRGDLVDSYQVSYSIYTQSFLKELRPNHSALPFGLSFEERSALRSLVSKEDIGVGISQLELSSFIGQRLLRDTDAASMAVSLEVRVPLLDHEFIETVSRLPSEIRYQPWGKKQVLRDIALSRLSTDTFNRPKSGFVLPIDVWLRNRLGSSVRDTLLDTVLCQSVGLNADAVARLWQAFDEQAPGLYWSRVWALYVLLHWCREHRMKI